MVLGFFYLDGMLAGLLDDGFLLSHKHAGHLRGDVVHVRLAGPPALGHNLDGNLGE